MGVSHSVHGTQWQLEGLCLTFIGAVFFAIALQYILSMKMGIYFARPLAYLLSMCLSLVFFGKLFTFVQSKRKHVKPAGNYTKGLDHTLGVTAALVCMFISFLASWVPNVGDWSLLIGPIGLVLLLATMVLFSRLKRARSQAP